MSCVTKTMVVPAFLSARKWSKHFSWNEMVTDCEHFVDEQDVRPRPGRDGEGDAYLHA